MPAVPMLGRRFIQTDAKCPICEEKLRHGGTCTTLVGFSSPPGHDHDDNCKSRVYWCKNGHEFTINIRNRCPACEWVGKKDCFCHKDKKVDAWPEDDSNFDWAQFTKIGVQKLRVLWESDSQTISISGGEIHIDNDVSNRFYWLPSNLVLETHNLVNRTWYYIYVSAPTEGFIVKSRHFKYSVVAPSLYEAKKGFYNSDRDRCIGCFYND